MSLEAFIWASSLPMGALNLAERCVLSKLADHAHRDGSNAWRSTESMAEELECSQRTVQRAQAGLRDRGFIFRGDQKLVEHIRKDRRPVVYDLNLKWASDNIDTPSHGVTDLVRGDRSGSDGVSTDDAHRTVNEPFVKTKEGNHRGAVTPRDYVTGQCRVRGIRGHDFDPISGWCLAACGVREDQAS